MLFLQLFANILIDVYFSPEQRCLPQIIKEIDKAKDSIFLQSYSFTSKKIASSLIKARERGVKIFVMTDKSQIRSKSSVVLWLASKGVPIFVDYKVAIAHNKVIVIDKKVVLTGSYNWTKAAEFSNAENLLVIRDKKIVKLYMNNWKKRAKKSKYLSYKTLKALNVAHKKQK